MCGGEDECGPDQAPLAAWPKCSLVRSSGLVGRGGLAEIHQIFRYIHEYCIQPLYNLINLWACFNATIPFCRTVCMTRLLTSYIPVKSKNIPHFPSCFIFFIFTHLF
eukprot:TRINITY_DN43794_c0_g1_i1.p1 TRINITY_DN43794_c0_g1~~TRINITY_DN43794_c0_g1_i1.p1  ORF type:complete len:107 (-),score=2.17 TRINITY_DN43794_c0_g1_i1:177-497(-)